ncbi:hypothetical protein Holit_02435 [Hollandina sp. SP2]
MSGSIDGKKKRRITGRLYCGRSSALGLRSPRSVASATSLPPFLPTAHSGILGRHETLRVSLWCRLNVVNSQDVTQHKKRNFYIEPVKPHVKIRVKPQKISRYSAHHGVYRSVSVRHLGQLVNPRLPGLLRRTMFSHFLPVLTHLIPCQKPFIWRGRLVITFLHFTLGIMGLSPSLA